ncbi:MAG: hypothetical protein JOZ55_11040, partial [Alphaproteobacteria bacterium]|nr:hypothetical protein [Alphaproteobacteria bacterium]
MSTPKPQIRIVFPTPICQHFLPVAAEANTELKQIILDKFAANGERPARKGWRSPPDLEQWGGAHVATLMRVVRELADGMTATRAGARVSVDWRSEVSACVRNAGEKSVPSNARSAFWSGIYYVDDGYQKSDDEALGGECELKDPRGAQAAAAAPQYAFRVPGGLTAGQTERIRPNSGMIILHPAWLARSERPFSGPAP